MWTPAALFLLVACTDEPERAPVEDPPVETGSVDDTSTTPKPVGGPPARLSGELSTESADARIDAADDVLGFGGLAAAGDVDGDGIGDVLLAAPGDTNAMFYGDTHGQTWLVSGGSLAGNTTVDTLAAGSVEGVRSGDKVGLSMTLLGDWNGDGFDDFALGAPGTPETNGRVAVVYGPFTGDVRFDAADALLSAPTGALAGAALVGGADFTGDVRPDLLVVSSDSFAHDREEVWLISEPIEGTVELDDVASAHLEFPSTMHGMISGANAGDLDGDGLPTLAVLARLPGQLYLFDAPLVGDLGPDAAASALSISEDYGVFASISDGADSDGDGYAELPIGFQLADASAGVVFLIGQPSDPRGDLDTEARATLRQEDGSGVGVGIDISFVGDLDADGLDDLAVGAIHDDYAAWTGDDGSRGVVYLLYGPLQGDTRVISTSRLLMPGSWERAQGRRASWSGTPAISTEMTIQIWLSARPRRTCARELWGRCTCSSAAPSRSEYAALVERPCGRCPR